MLRLVLTPKTNTASSLQHLVIPILAQRLLLDIRADNKRRVCSVASTFLLDPPPDEASLLSYTLDNERPFEPPGASESIVEVPRAVSFGEPSGTSSEAELHS